MQEKYFLEYYQAILNKDFAKAAILYLFNENEKSQYSGQYLALTYSNLFKDYDPEELIKAFLESEENKELYDSLKQELGKIAGNYYIASYQATIEQNPKKAMWLDSLSSEERINYPNEYNQLNYSDIFKNNDPDEVLNSFYGNDQYKEFYLQAIDSSNVLATEENIAAREANYLRLMSHPLQNYCPNIKNGLAIIDSLASISFSTVINKSQFVKVLALAIDQSTIISEILSTLAIYANLIKDNKQFSIALIGENIQEYDPTRDEDQAGFFHPLKNSIVITNENKKIDLATLVHEFAHHIMYLLFENMGNPYYNNSSELAGKYHRVIKKTLLSIKHFIHQNFNIETSHIKDSDDNWGIGNKLYTMLHYINDQEIGIEDQKSFLTLLKQKYALAKILNIYAGGYNHESEDKEFIVRFAEIIADNLFEAEIIEILEPIAQYWQEFVSPVLLEYQDQDNISNICLPLDLELFKLYL
jgi:hypothetical protein